MVLKERAIRKSIAYTCSGVAIFLTFCYIASKQIDLFGESTNASAIGAYVFLFSSAALLFGIYRMDRDGLPTSAPSTVAHLCADCGRYYDGEAAFCPLCGTSQKC
jgi:hypothetical protein